MKRHTFIFKYTGFLVFIGFILMSFQSCKEEPKIEVIPDLFKLDMEYTSRPSTKPEVEIGKDEFTQLVNKTISNNKLTDIIPKGEGISIEGKLYLNDKGNIDKILFLKVHPQTLEQEIFLPVFEKLQFTPAEANNKKVKSQTIFSFSSAMETDTPDWTYSLSPAYEKHMVFDDKSSTYFVAVEEMPEPIGGISAIQKNIVYPEVAKRAGIEGKVFVLAFVNEEGIVDKAEIIKGIGAGCDEAALEAIKDVKFKPGRQRGKPVKVKVTIPVVFRLQ